MDVTADLAGAFDHFSFLNMYSINDSNLMQSVKHVCRNIINFRYFKSELFIKVLSKLHLFNFILNRPLQVKRIQMFIIIIAFYIIIVVVNC